MRSLIERSIRLTGSGLTGYDAAYAALAEELGGCWLTFDAQAAEKIGDPLSAVNLFSVLPVNWGGIP